MLKAEKPFVEKLIRLYRDVPVTSGSHVSSHGSGSAL
jgi:hypothetical protein